jgi:hypothetical protein
VWIPPLLIASGKGAGVAGWTGIKEGSRAGKWHLGKWRNSSGSEKASKKNKKIENIISYIFAGACNEPWLTRIIGSSHWIVRCRRFRYNQSVVTLPQLYLTFFVVFKGQIFFVHFFLA